MRRGPFREDAASKSAHRLTKEVGSSGVSVAHAGTHVTPSILPRWDHTQPGTTEGGSLAWSRDRLPGSEGPGEPGPGWRRWCQRGVCCGPAFPYWEARRDQAGGSGWVPAVWQPNLPLSPQDAGETLSLAEKPLVAPRLKLHPTPPTLTLWPLKADRPSPLSGPMSLLG